MAGRVERWLMRRWYGDTGPGAVLRWLSHGFRWLVLRRAHAYRTGRRTVMRVAAPVIVVGNVVIGGTGKTPLTIALARWLLVHGWRPGVVTRGYGRNGQAPAWADAEGDPCEVGDEPVLIAQRSGVPVRVDHDRVRGARELVAAGCDIVIADDGLQHYRLGRDLEIEVVDGARGYGNGLLLPAGPLREPVSRALHCDLRVISGAASGNAGGGSSFSMDLRPEGLVAIASGESLACDVFRGQRVHGVAGIGNPGRFFDGLRALGIEVVEHRFPDHYRYAASDLAFPDRLPVVMTEKDAVKCRRFAAPHWFALRVEARLPEAFYDALAARLDGEKET